jgi:hypothetical protein
MGTPDEKPDCPPAQSPVDQLIRRVVVGGGLGIGIVLYLYQLFSHSPDQWAGLLKGWGPWFIPVMLGLYFCWDLMRLGVGHVGKLAAGVTEMGTALRSIAEKDDRQWEELRLLTQYSSRQNDHAVDLMQETGKKLDLLTEGQCGVIDCLAKLPCDEAAKCLQRIMEKKADGK